jgi:GNAT superfamily N-acetyltransferase
MFPGRDEIYALQFTLDRAHRLTGLGHRSISSFISQRYAPGTRVVLDVLERNPAGQVFWREVGFEPYARNM